jgi:hypothetical protein
MSAVKKGVTALALVAAGLAVAWAAAPWAPAPRAESLFVKAAGPVQENAAKSVRPRRGVRVVQAEAHPTIAPTGTTPTVSGCPTPCPDCTPTMVGRAGP